MKAQGSNCWPVKVKALIAEAQGSNCCTIKAPGSNSISSAIFELDYPVMMSC